MSLIRTSSRARRIVVQPWERAIVIRRGTLDRVVDSGRHRRRRDEQWHLVDTRPAWLTLAGQEVLTSDAMQLRVTPVARFRIVDATAWLTRSTEPLNDLYAHAQLAVRSAITTRSLDEVLAARAELLNDARDGFLTAAASLGAEVLDFELRDITLSAELRHAFAETALAREQGRAKLEAARAETAALRSLANAAQLLEAHPSLLELRALDAASGGRGQFVVRIGDAGPVVTP